MASLFKNTFVIILLLLTLAFGYYLFMQNKNATLNVQNNGVSLDVAVESAQFLQRLNELKTISLDNDIFLDPRFAAFTSYSGEVQPESVGQSNPFKPN